MRVGFFGVGTDSRLSTVVHISNLSVELALIVLREGVDDITELNSYMVPGQHYQ